VIVNLEPVTMRVGDLLVHVLIRKAIGNYVPRLASLPRLHLPCIGVPRVRIRHNPENQSRRIGCPAFSAARADRVPVTAALAVIATAITIETTMSITRHKSS
jgi:hypothetical protein